MTSNKRRKTIGGSSPTETEINVMKAVTGPHMGSAMVMLDFAEASFGDLALGGAIHFLKKGGEAVNGGDLSTVEAMLYSQAVALNTIFAEMARRAALNLNDYPKAAEERLRLAFKAQNQCRMTLETLAAIKNPPTVFAKQANIANGPQQVNNGVAGARESLTAPIKVLEAHHDSMDDGATGAATAGNPALVPVGGFDGAKKQ